MGLEETNEDEKDAKRWAHTYPRNWLKPSGKRVSRLGPGWRTPSFFPTGRRTTPGAYRPEHQIKEETTEQTLIALNDDAKHTLQYYLERELELYEKQKSRYLRSVINLQAALPKYIEAGLVEQVKSTQEIIEIYESMINSYTAQEEVIKINIHAVTKGAILS